MTINLGCHFICLLVLRQKFQTGVTFLQPLIQIRVNNGHTDFSGAISGLQKNIMNFAFDVCWAVRRPSSRWI